MAFSNKMTFVFNKRFTHILSVLSTGGFRCLPFAILRGWQDKRRRDNAYLCLLLFTDNKCSSSSLLFLYRLKDSVLDCLPNSVFHTT